MILKGIMTQHFAFNDNIYQNITFDTDSLEVSVVEPFTLYNTDVITEQEKLGHEIGNQDFGRDSYSVAIDFMNEEFEIDFDDKFDIDDFDSDRIYDLGNTNDLELKRLLMTILQHNLLENTKQSVKTKKNKI